MTRGLGVDIVEIARISDMLEKYGVQFLEKIYTPLEIEFCSAKAFPAIHFAGRWAAKEAFYKALPDNLQAYSSWKSIQVLPGSAGRRPVVDICDKQLEDELNNNGIMKILLSISHEKSHCIAAVILE